MRAPPKSLWTEVRVYPAEEVTTRDAEADPREAGLYVAMYLPRMFGRFPDV